MNKVKTIRCYDYVNHPYEPVRDSLSAEDSTVFQDATKAATSHAQTLTSESRVNIGGIEVGTDISISVKEIENRPKQSGSFPRTRLQPEWGATKMPHLFPFMNAELSIYPLTAKETQLDFLGTYDPPLGVLGDALDAIVGHRIGEASVHRFIQNVATYLRSELSKSE